CKYHRYGGDAVQQRQCDGDGKRGLKKQGDGGKKIFSGGEGEKTPSLLNNSQPTKKGEKSDAGFCFEKKKKTQR
ncbi:hypothetical protein, partial [Neisseria meningitidis]|uniref:hypothetical protein n=1 Tax=Neisseria meningitidis TaxID=487 RepID=UPI00137611B8